MSGRTATRVLVGLVLVLAAVAIGVGAYNAGYAAGATSTGTAAAPIYPFYGPWFHWGFGFGFLWILFPLFFFGLIFLLFRAAFWGGRPRRYGPWYDEPGSRRDSDFDAWHRRAHGDEPGSQEGRAGGPTSGA